MSFSPVAGIQWVETLLSSPALSLRLLGFSPVAGIQWVETLILLASLGITNSFSPVAGIQWVETQERPDDFSKEVMSRFSPVAGIQWVETSHQSTGKLFREFQSRCRDSVG